jgi:uncharacterized protein (DUF4415 family)
MSSSRNSKAQRKPVATRQRLSRTDFARVRAAPHYVWDGVNEEDRPATTEELRTARPRGPQKAPTKTLMSMRFSRDVLSHFRASGPGWQARMDAVLRAHVARSRLPQRSKR